MSVVVPVLVTVAWKLLPGAPEPGLSVTWTPPAVTVSVPLAVPVTEESVVEVAVTVKG